MRLVRKVNKADFPGNYGIKSFLQIYEVYILLKTVLSLHYLFEYFSSFYFSIDTVREFLY